MLCAESCSFMLFAQTLGFSTKSPSFLNLHQEKYTHIKEQWRFTVKQKIPLSEENKQKDIAFQISKTGSSIAGITVSLPTFTTEIAFPQTTVPIFPQL